MIFNILGCFEVVFWWKTIKCARFDVWLCMYVCVAVEFYCENRVAIKVQRWWGGSCLYGPDYLCGRRSPIGNREIGEFNEKSAENCALFCWTFFCCIMHRGALHSTKRHVPKDTTSLRMRAFFIRFFSRFKRPAFVRFINQVNKYQWLDILCDNESDCFYFMRRRNKKYKK